MDLYARINIVASWGADIPKNHEQDGRQIANQAYASDWIRPRIQHNKVMDSPNSLYDHIEHNLFAHLFSDIVNRDVPI